MLKIDNLAASKDLDRAEMTAIAGGSIFQNNGINSNFNSGFLFASPQTNVAPVIQVDASQHTDVDLTNVTKSLTSVGSLLGGVKV
jgi:predicted transcriptional regulator